MPSPHVSRRSVARGAAWSLPAVAVAVAVPAFAASAGPAPVVTEAGRSCKCPGGRSPWTFNLNLTITTAGVDSFTIAITHFLVDGAPPVAFLGPSTVGLPMGEGDPVLLRFRLANSDGTHTITFTYTPTNTTTGTTGVPVDVVLTDVAFPPCKSGDSYSCA